MEIKKVSTNKNVTFILKGKLDIETSNDFGFTLNKEIDSKKNVALDIREVEYISSAGLRILLTAQKRADANKVEFKLVNPNFVVMKMLTLTGFDSLIKIEG